MNKKSLEVDVVVVGSGGGALVAALTAAHEGLKVVVVEKTEYIGGTTALSGGVAWIPNNPHIPEAKLHDSFEQSMRYLKAVTGEYGREEYLKAYAVNGRLMVNFLESRTQLEFGSAMFPDYKAELDGGLPDARSIQAMSYDGKLLGEHLGLLRPPLKQWLVLGGMMVEPMDIYHLSNQLRSWASFKHSAKLVISFLSDRLKGYPRGTRLTLGNALIARMLRSAIDIGIKFYVKTPAIRLIERDGRVVGVVVQKDGHDLEILARRGVVLGSGGFARNPEMVKKYLPFPDHHGTMVPEGNTGDGIHMGEQVGGSMGSGQFQNYLGTQYTEMREKNGKVTKYFFQGNDRPKPGNIVVNKNGLRFVDEGMPYNDFARVQSDTGCVPAWIICSHASLRKNGLGLLRPGPAWLRPLGKYLESGYFIRGNSIADLARKVGINADNLVETVRRNNEYAKTGIDPEFGKGSTLFARWIAASDQKPNPCLGPIVQGPFYAMKIVPGNLGTFCGLAANTNAQVVRENGDPIPGLYACGLDMHHPLSGTYPGGGSSIGPAMTFGYIAGMHLASQQPDMNSDTLSRNQTATAA